MYAEFRHLDGANAGETRVVRKEFVTIGRHPSADVSFDAQRDLEVSGRHAAVFRQDDKWMVRDLGSTNGTWVNGTRVKGDCTLANNDVLGFGQAGPRLVFQGREGEPATVPMTRATPDSARAPHQSGSAARAPRRDGTNTRIRREVRRQTAAWKRMSVVVVSASLLTLLGLIALTVAKNRNAERERAELLARSDSLLARMRITSASVASLEGALGEARRETERLRAALSERGVTGARADSLARALAGSLDRHEAVVRAAELDVDAIARSNGDAVGLVVSEFPDGRRVAGTGFAVRVKGDTGWIATSRHLVADSAGRPARRLGMIFNGSSQNFRTETVGKADSADLAILRVRVKGGVPVVRALGGAARPGEPVAILGFPFGLDFPVGGDWRRVGVRVSRFTGTVRNPAKDRLEVDSYGVGGSSGSPVFNAAGEVVGVVFGGDPASAGRTVYAVPAGVLTALLQRLGVMPE